MQLTANQKRVLQSLRNGNSVDIPLATESALRQKKLIKWTMSEGGLSLCLTDLGTEVVQKIK